MFVILSGRIAIVPRDGLGQAVPVAAFAQLVGAPVEDMMEVVPGEVIAEIGQLSGRTDSSVLDARAVEDVEAIVVPPAALRTLLVAEAELGERILRALILRRVALIELGFGGPVLIGALKSPDVIRLSHFLERNAIPFRVLDPDEDREASALLARVAPTPDGMPMAVLSDGTVLKNPTKQALALALGLVATSFRPDLGRGDLRGWRCALWLREASGAAIGEGAAVVAQLHTFLAGRDRMAAIGHTVSTST